MSDERQRLEAAIAALEAHRAVLGDAVVETALAHVLRTADAPLGELHRGEIPARYALRCGLC